MRRQKAHNYSSHVRTYNAPAHARGQQRTQGDTTVSPTKVPFSIFLVFDSFSGSLDSGGPSSVRAMSSSSSSGSRCTGRRRKGRAPVCRPPSRRRRCCIWSAQCCREYQPPHQLLRVLRIRVGGQRAWYQDVEWVIRDKRRSERLEARNTTHRFSGASHRPERRRSPRSHRLRPPPRASDQPWPGPQGRCSRHALRVCDVHQC